jgi:hypothetical protein
MASQNGAFSAEQIECFYQNEQFDRYHTKGRAVHKVLSLFQQDTDKCIGLLHGKLCGATIENQDGLESFFRHRLGT